MLAVNMHWSAFELDSVPTRGTTKPAFLRCRASGGDFDKCALLLVKTNLSEEQFASEYVVNRIAGELGIATPRPAVVHLSEEFVDSVATHPDRSKTILVPGWAAGNQKLYNLAETIAPPFRDKALRDAETLFALDMIGRQSDRREDNPNAARSGLGIVAFDFQLAFIMEWEEGLSEEERREYATKGNARNPLRHAISSGTDFPAIFQRFESLDTAWFRGVEKELPKEWQPYCRKIRARVHAELKNQDTLRRMMEEASRA